MAGLALGSFSFGRRSGRIRRPLRLYGFLEIGVAVFAFLLPTLLAWVDSIYVAAALRSDGVDFRLTLLRVAMAFGVLVIPTFFMGGTLPVLTRFLVHRHGEFGTRLAWLYGVNTLGAVAGALFAGFLLVPWLGVWHTQLTAVVVNLAVGAAAVMTDRRAPLTVATEGGTETARSSRTVAAEPLEPAAKPLSTLPLRLAFWGTAVSGMCALAFEVLWTRGITLAVGSTTYSFTVMLAAFLVGIWLGSWLHAAVPLRRVHESLQFGLVLVVIGASGFAVSQMIPRLPELVVRLNLGIYGDLQRIRPGTTLLLAFAVMLVPCVLMGVAFPLAGQARARLKESFGQSVGDTLGLNTLGAIVGSLSAGFLLIPLLGLQRGMLLTAAIDIAYGVVVLGAFLTSRMERRRWLVWASGFGVAALAFALPFLSPPWDANVMGGFNNNQLRKYVDARGQIDVPAAVAGANVVYYREGRGSTVSVVETDNRALLINGKAVASDVPSDLQHELLLGHVPVLLHRDPRSVLVVGLGAGVTAGAVAAHGAIEEIAVVEIEPAVVEGAAQFAHVNDHVLEDSRIEITFQDGRNYLKTTRRKFDVITADPIHPWAYGAGYLYTTQYYQLAGERLDEGGVMCQWVPAYELSLENFKSVVGTFAESFAYATLWQASNDMVLIGSDAPIQVDVGALAERLGQPAVTRQLAPLGLERALSFLAGFMMDSAGIKAYVEGAILNTDDNLYLEFSSPLSIGAPQLRGNLRSIESYRANPMVVATNVSSMFASVAEAEEAFRVYQRAKSRVVEAQLVRGMLAQSRDAARRPVLLQRVNGQLRGVMRRLPDYAPVRIELAAGLAQLGAIQLANREHRKAAMSCQEAVELVPLNADCHRVLGLAMLQLGEHALAVEHLETALHLQPRSWILHYQLSAALNLAGRNRDALEVVQEGLAIKPGHAGMERLGTHLRSVSAGEAAP